MYKSFILLALFAVAYGSTETRQISVKSKHIKHVTTPIRQGMKAVDWCPTCVNTFDELIYFIIDGTIEVGIFTACNDLCDYVTQKSTNPYLPAICSIGCDIVGVNEFIKLATEVDLDPIYFCESLNFCPVKDDGDAKFVSFMVAPPHGESATTFVLDMTYQTTNGTGTSQLLVVIQTIDAIKIAPFFLVEEKKPGLYSERISVDTTPDPDCESATNPCEEWFSGVYNVTVSLCNGECGSHRPHSRLYDTVKGSFRID